MGLPYNRPDGDNLDFVLKPINYVPPPGDAVDFWMAYDQSGLVVLITEEPYGISLSKSWEEPYTVYRETLVETHELIYGIQLNSIHEELYGDVPILVKIWEEHYTDADVHTVITVLTYDDAHKVCLCIEESWNIYDSLLKLVSEPYSITKNKVFILTEEIYNVESHNLVSALHELPYYILDNITTNISPTVNLLISGISVDFSGITLQASISSYCWECTVTLLHESDYLWIQEMSDAVLSLNGTDYLLFVESKEESETNKDKSYKLKFLSPAAQLDSPYADVLTATYSTTIYTKDLVTAMAAIKGISVDYQILNYALPNTSIQINDETPLAVIKKVVNAIGGKIQTKPDGSLLIISEYNVSPLNFDSIVPEHTLSTAIDIVSITRSSDIRSGFNAYDITDNATTSDNIWIEEITDSSGSTYIKGFRVPFSDGSFNLKTSGGSTVSVSKYIHPIIETIPVVVKVGDPIWEIVEFINWVGTTQYPIYEIVAWDWIEDELGNLNNASEITWNELGSIQALNTNAPSEGLLRIQYKTKYWRWDITGPKKKEIQLYVSELGN